jgi:8-oxo-dGTP diphosphatase
VAQRNVILAAGGILYRTCSGHPECALVKSAKDRTWCLPKGKADKRDNSLLKTAVREVEEETGCMVNPLEYAGEFQYYSGNCTKLVLMWHMRLVQEKSRPLHPDVLEINWLNPDNAVAHLSHKWERKFLRQILQSTNKFINPSWRIAFHHSGNLESLNSHCPALNRETLLPNAMELNLLSLKK